MSARNNKKIRRAEYGGLPHKEADSLIRHLENYKSFVETMESRGQLDTDLPIEDSSRTSYSETIEDSIEFVKQNTREDSAVSLSAVKKSAENALEGLVLLVPRKSASDISETVSPDRIVTEVTENLRNDKKG